MPYAWLTSLVRRLSVDLQLICVTTTTQCTCLRGLESGLFVHEQFVSNTLFSRGNGQAITRILESKNGSHRRKKKKRKEKCGTPRLFSVSHHGDLGTWKQPGDEGQIKLMNTM